MSRQLPPTLRAARRALAAGALPPPEGPPAPPACPRCGGAGFLAAPGQGLARCGCRPPGLRVDLAAASAAALGADPPPDLAAFLARPLPAVVSWGGRAHTRRAQRESLAEGQAAARAFIAEPGAAWLYLYGPCGSGKSHLARAIYHALAPTRPAAFLSAAGLSAYLRAGLEQHSADERLAALAALDLLVVDDLGSEPLSPWGLARLHDLVEARSAHRRPTVFTANQAPDELARPGADPEAALAWERIASRIGLGLRRPLPLIAGDYRRAHWENPADADR